MPVYSLLAPKSHMLNIMMWKRGVFLYKKRNYTLTLMCISHSNEDHNGSKLMNINIKEKLNIFERFTSVLGLKNVN